MSRRHNKNKYEVPCPYDYIDMFLVCSDQNKIQSLTEFNQAKNVTACAALNFLNGRLYSQGKFIDEKKTEINTPGTAVALQNAKVSPAVIPEQPQIVQIPHTKQRESVVLAKEKPCMKQPNTKQLKLPIQLVNRTLCYISLQLQLLLHTYKPKPQQTRMLAHLLGIDPNSSKDEFITALQRGFGVILDESSRPADSDLESQMDDLLYQLSTIGMNICDHSYNALYIAQKML